MIATVQETKPPAGCRGGIIPYSVTRLFRRTSNLWQRPPALLRFDKVVQPTGKLAPAGAALDGCRGLGLLGPEEEREAGTWGEPLRDEVDTLQTARLGHLSKAKGLVQGLGAPAQAPLRPPGTAAQTCGLKAAGITCLWAELPPSPPGPGTRLCAHSLPSNSTLALAHQPALKSLFFTPVVPAKHCNHHQSLAFNLHI